MGWQRSEWVRLVGQSAIDDAIEDKAWLLEGNAGTTVGTDFIGTTDNVGLAFKTNDAERMRILNGGNVGIGITDPSTLLEVKDNEAIKIGKAFFSSGQSGTARMLHLATNAWADDTDWNFPTTNEAGALIQMVNDDIVFWRHGGGETAGYDYGTFSQSMRIHNSGNVGIGDFVLSPPDDLLHVKGIIRIPGSEGNDYQIRGGDNISTGVAIRAISNPSNNQSIFGVESSGSATRFGVTQGNGTFAREGFWVGTYDNGELTPSVGLNRTGSDMILLTDNTERVRILDNGNVGVGATDPTQKLDINGQIRIRGGTPGAGKVLTSDANGVGTWEDVSSGGCSGVQTVSSNSFTVTGGVCLVNVNWSNSSGTNRIITMPNPANHAGETLLFYMRFGAGSGSNFRSNSGSQLQTGTAGPTTDISIANGAYQKHMFVSNGSIWIKYI